MFLDLVPLPVINVIFFIFLEKQFLINEGYQITYDKLIEDKHIKDKIINFDDIFTKSSNVGSIQLIENIGIEKQKDFFIKISLLGVGVGLLFTFFYALLGERVFFLFSKDKDLLASFSSYCFWVVIGQVIGAYSFVLDGVYCGLGEYRFLRNMMLFSVLFGCLPFFLGAYFWEEAQWVWAGIVGLSVWRSIFCTRDLWVKKF